MFWNSLNCILAAEDDSSEEFFDDASVDGGCVGFDSLEDCFVTVVDVEPGAKLELDPAVAASALEPGTVLWTLDVLFFNF